MSTSAPGEPCGCDQLRTIASGNLLVALGRCRLALGVRIWISEYRVFSCFDCSAWAAGAIKRLRWWSAPCRRRPRPHWDAPPRSESFTRPGYVGERAVAAGDPELGLLVPFPLALPFEPRRTRRLQAAPAAAPPSAHSVVRPNHIVVARSGRTGSPSPETTQSPPFPPRATPSAVRRISPPLHRTPAHARSLSRLTCHHMHDCYIDYYKYLRTHLGSS